MPDIDQSTGIVFGMACAVIALVVLIAILVDEVIRLRANETADVEADHAACTALIADMTSRRWGAVILRDLADRYDTTSETRIINKIKREQWTPEGEVLPVLWLRHHADLLDPPDTTGENT